MCNCILFKLFAIICVYSLNLHKQEPKMQKLCRLTRGGRLDDYLLDDQCCEQSLNGTERALKPEIKLYSTFICVDLHLFC